MNREYVKDISRMGCSIFDIKAWYEGESRELKNKLDFGFYNTMFVIEGENVDLYYDKEECDNFYKILDEKLTEDFFNELCDNFFNLIHESKGINDGGKIFKLMVKCWPALAIFEELSNCPEYGTDSMIRRLIRVRKSTEAFSYELSKRLDLREEVPNNYIFFHGEIINKPFEEFLKENGFEIIKWKEKK